MVIVRLTGGLGNQMFQYAFYKKLILSGHDAAIDDFSFQKNHQHENLRLPDVFPKLSFKRADEKNVHDLADVKASLYNKVKNRLFGNKKSHIRAYDLIYYPQYANFTGDEAYLDGYWQSEKYFADIVPVLKKDFEFNPLPDNEYKELASRIASCNSVAIHVRKGKDFNSVSRKGICDTEYYRQAVHTIRESVINPVFFVFSDNLNWCRENLTFIDPVFSETNETSGRHSYLDMQLMSLCRNNIIANSSYSWWSAWLNAHEDKLVIAPEKWFNDNTVRYNVRDLVPETWKTI